MAFFFSKKAGLSPAMRDTFLDISEFGPLPFIRGKWYYVDPTSGSATAGGESPDNAVDSIETAYDKCISGAGDGIVLMSRGTGTASQTTSYLTQELAWDKHGITVVGACAPVKSYQRARVANKTVTTTATLTAVANTSISRATGSFVDDGWVAGMKFITNVDSAAITVVTVSALTITVTGTLTVGAHTSMTSVMPDMITVSGSNNVFQNVMFWNGGTNALEIGGFVVTGHRNAFINCHITGAAGASAAATHYSLKLNGAQENLFRNCTIGSDSVDRGNNADTELILLEHVARNRFEGCEFLSYVSAGTAHGAVRLNATTEGRGTVFMDCIFNSSTSVTTPAAVFLATGSNDKVLVCGNSVAWNFTAWGLAGVVFTGMPTSAASAGGGLATTA